MSALTPRPSATAEQMTQALTVVRDQVAVLWQVAWEYGRAVEAETDALLAYAQAVAADADEVNVRADREVLVHTLGRRDAAGRRLGLSGQPPALVRAVRELLTAARTGAAARGAGPGPPKRSAVLRSPRASLPSDHHGRGNRDGTV